jgi:lipopolysaccharide export system protein LptA
VCLAILAAGYQLYALVAVPLIEPTVRLKPLPGADPSQRAAGKDRIARQHDELRTWFGDHDWELTSPKVFELDRAMLLCKEYENHRDGTVHLEPCTVIMLGEQHGKPLDQWKREAVILQAPAGADLLFDPPLDFSAGNKSTLKSGRLAGKFTVRSDQKAPGPDDDLWIAGSDAQLADNRVTSLHPIEFRLGSSFGSGRELRIDLTPADTKSAVGASFNGIASIEVRRDVDVLLDVDGLERNRTSTTTKPAAADTAADRSPAALLRGQDGPQPPLRITSKGPFRFDMVKYVATFHDQVDVLRLRPQGQSDHLQGEVLSLFFAPVADGAAAAFPKLEPSRIEVRGLPVIMQSTLEDLDARGDFLTYELKTGRISLEGKRPVSVRRGGSRVEAPKLIYEPSARSRFGRFSAIGPGAIDAASPDDAQQHYRARWKRQAVFGPDQAQHLVALVGEAWFQEPSTGTLAGEEIYVWFDERPQGPNRAPGNSASAAPALVPNRMLAQGRVHLESPQIVCNVEKLQTWFIPVTPLKRDPRIEELPPPAAAGQSTAAAPQAVAAIVYRRDTDRRLPSSQGRRGSASNAAISGRLTAGQPTYVPASTSSRRVTPVDIGKPRPETQASSIGGGPAPATPGASRYFVQGKLLQVQLRLLSAPGSHPRAELSQLRVLESVRVTESIAGQSAGAPLVLTGDQVDYQQTNDLDGKLAVVGQPAHVEGRNMVLDGPIIHLNRATSHLDVEGAGRMIVPSERDLEGRALNQPRPIHVTWRRQLHFDGRVAHFDDGVTAELDGQTLRTQSMDVAFSKPISFANPPRDRQPEVAEIACRGNVLLDRPALESGQLVSVERMQAASLRVNRLTGGITAEGPGWMTSVRHGSLAMPAPAAGGEPAADPGDGLIYLRVEFLTLATGNLNYRTMEFGNRVKTVFGPVASWEGVVSEEEFDRIGADGKPLARQCGYLESQQLLVSQVRDADGRESFALDASGNAKLEGINFQDQSFVARGNHIKYEQAKDLVILEGDGRVDAELQRQVRVGAKPEYTSSRKIDFWLARADRPARVYVDGFHHIDLVTPPRNQAASTARPNPPGTAAPLAPSSPPATLPDGPGAAAGIPRAGASSGLDTSQPAEGYSTAAAPPGASYSGGGVD